MSSSGDKLYSDVLTREKLLALLHAIPATFRVLLGECVITADYGFGCEIHPDLQYVSMRVGTSWIDRFVEDSLEQRIVIPAQSDFCFSARGNRLQVLFCHESDIHLGGSDDELIRQFTEVEPFSNYRFRSKEDIAHNS